MLQADLLAREKDDPRRDAVLVLVVENVPEIPSKAVNLSIGWHELQARRLDFCVLVVEVEQGCQGKSLVCWIAHSLTMWKTRQQLHPTCGSRSVPPAKLTLHRAALHVLTTSLIADDTGCGTVLLDSR